MKYIKEVFKYLKYLIAPVLAYIKGYADSSVKTENKILREQNDLLRSRFERIEKIIIKYDGIRDAIRKRLSEKDSHS